MKKVIKSEKFRFLLVGIVNTLVCYLIFAIMNLLGFGRILEILPILSGYFFSSLMAFYLYKRHVFKSRGKLLEEYFKFIVVYLPSIFLNILLLPMIVRETNINAYVAQGVLLVVLTVLSYVGHKFFTFKKKQT